MLKFFGLPIQVSEVKRAGSRNVIANVLKEVVIDYSVLVILCCC
jgi:hypothetical protein